MIETTNILRVPALMVSAHHTRFRVRPSVRSYRYEREHGAKALHDHLSVRVGVQRKKGLAVMCLGSEKEIDDLTGAITPVSAYVGYSTSVEQLK